MTDERKETGADATLLVRALAANAGFSGLSGLVLVAVADPVAAWIGIEGSGWLRAVGVGLLLFAAGLVRLVRDEGRSRTGVLSVIAADAGWVAGSAVLLVGFPGLLSTAGEWAVAAVAVVVAGLACAQFVGLRRRA